MTNNNEQLHWLVRPTTIRKLWIGFIAVLALVVLAQTGIYIKGYFVVDGWFGFGAVYGFGCCLLMVLVAKLLGRYSRGQKTITACQSRHQTKRPRMTRASPGTG